MKNRLYYSYLLLAAGGLALSPAPGLAATSNTKTNAGYTQINLVSDLTNGAPHRDARLVNPWGLVAGPETIWVNDNGTGLTTAYGPGGEIHKTPIHLPAPGGGSGAPSGLVFNDTLQFVITNGAKHGPCDFLMSTEDGTIAAWSSRLSGTNAVIVVDNSASGAVYKGLGIVEDASGAPHIYAANFHGGTVDIFDEHFHFVSSFTDTNLPAHFAPFNVKNIRGRVCVTFALQKLPDRHDDQAGPGNGFIDLFDTDGTLLRRFASQGALNSPWGIAPAPFRFGKFSNALLVGNFGDGTINAFDLLTGKSLGPLTDASGAVLMIDGLWGLSFEREPLFGHEDEFSAMRLYFTAGPNGESDGLMGYLKPVNFFFPVSR